MMQPLCHERPGQIALTFSQNMNPSQQVDTALPFFGADADASLESSILGSVIPGLDPDPPLDPQIASLSSNSFAPHANTAAPRLGSEEPDPSSLSATKSDSSSDPARQGKGSEGPREWAGGGGGAGSAARGGYFEAGLSPLVGQGLGGGGGVGEEMARNTRLYPVKHGLRVLLRGTSRCGKSAILWDYCHRAALAGHRVIMVCLKRENEDLAHLPRSMRTGGRPGAHDELRGWEASALSKVGMKYVRSRDDIAWYLASLHTLGRSEWPTVIAVDDIDKIIETTAAGHTGGPSTGSGTGGGGGSGGGGTLGAAALRIFALLQDTAEFFDDARAEAVVAAAASRTATTLPTSPPTPGTAGESSATLADHHAAPGDTPTTRERIAAASTPPSTSGFGGAPTETSRPPGTPIEGSTAAAGRSQRPGAGSLRGMGGTRETAVRVVGTCTTSDRGMLSLYGRFVHAVARVQNTTGPDCFSLKLDPGIGTAHFPPPAPPVTQTPPYGVGTRGGGVTVEFVRSQMDGSFALF